MTDLLMQSQFERIDEILTAVRRSQEFLVAPTPRPEKSIFAGLSQKETRKFSVARMAMRMFDRLNRKGHVNGGITALNGRFTAR